MAEQDERNEREVREQAQELRNLMTQLDAERSKLGAYMSQARSQANQLGETWDNPVVAEVQGMLAGILSRVEGLQTYLSATVNKVRAAADTAEEASLRREYERKQGQGQEEKEQENADSADQ